jgi:hypothetical protein
MVVPKQSMKRGEKTVIPDGTLLDEFNLVHGYWEANYFWVFRVFSGFAGGLPQTPRIF